MNSILFTNKLIFSFLFYPSLLQLSSKLFDIRISCLVSIIVSFSFCCYVIFHSLFLNFVCVCVCVCVCRGNIF